MRGREQEALFGIVIYEGVEPIDIGGTVGVLSMAQRVVPGVRCVTIAERAGPVRLAGGLSVIAQTSFSDAPSCAQILVCGGPGWRTETKNPAMLSFLKRAPAARVGSVCTGALILGASGLLDGRMATTRRLAVGTETVAPLTALGELAPGAQRVAAAVVADGPVLTGGGVSLAIDATLYALGEIYGEDAALEIAKVIEYDRAYSANKAALGHRETGGGRARL